MTAADIQRAFGIDRNSAVPIYQQLEERLRTFAAGSPAGTRLPSERAMSEALDLSRQTVKTALNALIEARLYYCGRKGTFTCGQPAEETDGDRERPQLSFSTYLGRSGHGAPLKLLLFESFPNQQHFWQKTIRHFNLERHGIKAEIEFLPDNELSLPQLAAFLEEHPADLLQCSSCLENASLMAPLPRDLAAELADPAEYLVECYQEFPEEFRLRLLPVYSNYFSCYYNRTLAEKHRPGDFTERIFEPDLCDRLQEMRRLIPEPPFITGTIGDFILARGVGDTFAIEELDPYLGELDRMRGKRLIHADITLSITERLHDQFSGRQFFMLDFSTLALHHFSDVEHRIGVLPLQPPEGRKIYGGASFFGIHRRSRRQAEATIFLNYLLSPPVRQRIVRELNGIPYHRSGIAHLQELYPEHDLAWWRRTVERSRAFQHRDWSFFVGRGITDIFRDLLAGKIDLERARTKMHLRYAGMCEAERSQFYEKIPSGY